MITLKKLKRKLYKLYPLSIAKKNYDFAGTMVPTNKEIINNIVLCLDLDEEVLEKCLSFKPDLIITHHPFLYGKSKKQVLKDSEIKQRIFNKLKEYDIGVISLHTNFDEATNGMNDVLASKLKLKHVYTPSNCPIMRVGYLKIPLEVNNFAYYVKEKLNVSYACLTKYGKDVVTKVALIGGGGSSYYKYALEENADIYISGDVPHHIRRDVASYKFNYLDIPHEVERVFIPHMNDILLNIDETLNILLIDHEVEQKIF